jgi:hypothetical protein
MATPHSPNGDHAGDHSDSPPVLNDSPPVLYEDEAPRVLRLRLAAWDVVCTALLLIALVYLAVATNWPTRLFGFLGDVCEGETCGPVPYGIDMYIRPVVWGGIGAAVAAAALGPVVSLLKGWYMSFWPALALTLVMFSSVAGSMLTTFSERYWV